MYFYIYNGKVYWGRHQSIAPRRNSFSWIFRNKPMSEGRVYLSGGNIFTLLTEKDGNGRAIIGLKLPRQIHAQTYKLTPGVCYHIGQTGLIHQVESKHAEAMRHFKNAFRNRLNEYRGRYFLPIEKYRLCA